MHGEGITNQVKNMYILDNAIVQRFRQIIRFEIGPRHINMQPRQDEQHQSFPTKFIMTEEEVEEIVNDWPKEWCVLVLEDQLQQEE